MKPFFAFLTIVMLLGDASASAPVSLKTVHRQRASRDPRLVRQSLANTNFETGHSGPWFDESPGTASWAIEDWASPFQANWPAPRPCLGTKYMRVRRDADLSSGLAVLWTESFTASPGDQISFKYWIRSRRLQGNSLDLAMVVGRNETVLTRLSRFSSPGNNQWRSISVPLPVNTSTNIELVFYGYCGSNAEDAIAIDDIAMRSSPTSHTTTVRPSSLPQSTSPAWTTSPVENTTTGSHCGDYFRDANGTFSSPNNPQEYQDNLDCQYIIELPSRDSRIVLWIYISTEAGRDIVEVYDGSEIVGSPRLLTASGNTNHQVTSSSSRMLVRFRTDSSNHNFTGFFATYRSTPGVCNGGTFSGASTGLIQSPGQPGDYGDNLDCQYLIQVPQGRVQLTFLMVDMEENFDYVDVYDGPTTDSQLLARVTGNNTGQADIVSSFNTVLLRFRTDSIIQSRGFAVRYTAVDGDTSTELPSQPTSQSIQPSNEPSQETTSTPLPSDTTTESTEQSRETSQPTTEDGVTTMSSSMPSSEPSEETTSTPVPSDTTTESTEPSQSTTDRVTTMPVSTIPGGDCNQTLWAYSFVSVFTSPNYPGNYGNDLNCFYLIRALPSNYVIGLNFASFNTEGCCDFVEVYDGNSTANNLLARFSGIQNREVYSTSNQMLVRFKTDISIVSRGFSANYFAVVSPPFSTGLPAASSTPSPRTLTPTTTTTVISSPTPTQAAGCNYTFGDLTGVISSPNYPGLYQNSLDCFYLIRAPSTSYIISLNFSAFVTEGCCDFVQVYDGPTSAYPLLLRSSGSTIPQKVVSSGRQMLVRFTTDGSVLLTGFTAVYRAEIGTFPCNQTLGGYAGNISSPNYPGLYYNNLDCYYLIRAPSNNYVIALNFISFVLEEIFDYVQVYDGASTAYPMLMIASGTSLPNRTVSSSYEMLVRFKTGRSIARSGFFAQYSAIQTVLPPTSAPVTPAGSCVCNGGNFGGLSGIISSPNYGAYYGYDNCGCRYLITLLDVNLAVRLDFFALGTEPNYDFVEVYDGPTTSSRLLLRSSGSVKPNAVTASSNVMLVRFTTDGSVNNYPGFSASYTGLPISATTSPSKPPASSPSMP